MPDLFIESKAFAARHLARNHLDHQLEQLRRRLGLSEVAGVPVIRDASVPVDQPRVVARDARGRFLPRAYSKRVTVSRCMVTHTGPPCVGPCIMDAR